MGRTSRQTRGLIRGVVWVLAILQTNIHPCTTLRFPDTQGNWPRDAAIWDVTFCPHVQQVNYFGGSSVMVWAGINDGGRTALVHVSFAMTGIRH